MSIVRALCGFMNPVMMLLLPWLYCISATAADLPAGLQSVDQVDCIRKSQDIEQALFACQQDRPVVVTAVLGGEALFVSGSATLADHAVTSLQRLVAQLQQYPEILGVTIIGHTDDRGSAAYNLVLSKQRAFHVKSLLSQWLSEVTIEAAGVGESSPIADNATSAGRRLNRRVEIKVVVNSPG